jgi:hypothetical protein
VGLFKGRRKKGQQDSVADQAASMDDERGSRPPESGGDAPHESDSPPERPERANEPSTPAGDGSTEQPTEKLGQPDDTERGTGVEDDAEQPQATGTAPAAAAEPTGQAPVKVCPNCAVQERTTGEFCPHCGAPYHRKPRGLKRLSKRAKIIVGAVILVLLLAGGATAAVLKVQHDNDAKAEKNREEAAARQRAQQAAQAERERKADEQVQVALRRNIVKELQKAVTKDARGQVNDGLLDGPIKRTSCDPVGGGNVDDLTARTGKFECIAVNKENGDGTAEGYRFSATINYEELSYSWHLGS